MSISKESNARLKTKKGNFGWVQQLRNIRDKLSTAQIRISFWYQGLIIRIAAGKSEKNRFEVRNVMRHRKTATALNTLTHETQTAVDAW